MTRPPHLTLVDGSGFIFRAYHRLPPLTDPSGTPVGAVYGFTAMLWQLVEEARKSPEDDYMAVVLDAARTSFRNQLYPPYKANRPEPPEDLVPQFPLIRDAVRALGLVCLERDDVEADDVIASYAEAALAEGFEVTIVSSDKDLMQLVRPGLRLRDTMGDRWFDEAAVEAKWGVPPAQLAEVLALMGDSVDNVPGVPGVGPKTAAELVRRFGSVEGVLGHLAEIPRPRLKDQLAAHADALRLSRRLVELKRDLSLDPPLEALRLPERLDAGRAAEFFARHGFRSLLARLGEAHRPAPPPAPAAPPTPGRLPFGPYVTVTELDELDRWIVRARVAGIVAFDTETTHLDAMRADLVGFSLAVAPGEACYVPLAHVAPAAASGERPRQLAPHEALSRLKALLEDPAVLKVGQNLKYDLVVLAAHGIEVRPYEDTMLLSYALEGGLGGHGMDELAQRHLGHRPIAYSDVAGRRSFAEVPIDQATAYAAEDADVTLRLYDRLKPRLWQARVTRTYEWCDRPLVPVVAAMERTGIRVDVARLDELSAEFAGEMARLEAELAELAGRPFQPGSPKQLGEILFGELGQAGGRRGKSGAFSTDQTELERIAHEARDTPAGRIARLVLDWRQVAKLRSTYTEALKASVNPRTGRVHTSFSLAGTSTGRLASSDPNLQNIPVRTAEGRRIREAFVAEPGWVLLSADYNQIELRLLAHVADVPELKAAYAQAADIHALTARQLFGLTEAQPVAREQRATAKTVNFSIVYGVSAYGLAQRLGIERAEAQRFIDLYFARFPAIPRYMADARERARAQGFVTTLFGRRIHLPGIRSKSHAERGNAERAAINAPIQGSAADLMRRALVRMPAALRSAGLLRTRLLLSVHDELLFEAPEDEAGRAADVVRTVMERAAEPALHLSVPLGVEVGMGPNWGAAH
ncbi:MAG: DNA polymerase I [Sphingomonadaceae bacterium]|uniref:DNA polymerase I n=1 Tax=Thermaurantiacus sp. TaxID=2820283 RepID=UPI00298F3364|nr:DNA polymerase I [Thermaurantiacus sp.]MCS6986258.1 DNA polymerase I [Sphingomonadaceae bacterium]MDW8415705.1 DNA polymerase I [Thermaurantiacus sp.]